ncbi:MAG TPA: hypothetical protein VLA12_06150, partial [Planctomycetaceae bacterium]|nr:hypothetical protein [Planctomycetaceae bacterium]
AVIGVLGGMLGVALGLASGMLLGDLTAQGTSLNELFAESGLLSLVMTAPLFAFVMTCFASWIPALYAARQDPAVILQGE